MPHSWHKSSNAHLYGQDVTLYTPKLSPFVLSSEPQDNEAFSIRILWL